MMDGNDDFDIQKLRVDPEFVQQALKAKRKEWRRVFTVLPRSWEIRLLGATRICTYKLATELLYLHWLNKGKTIAVTSKVAAAAKLSTRSKSRALAELEQLGLITVDRGVRRAPRVTLLRLSGRSS